MVYQIENAQLRLAFYNLIKHSCSYFNLKFSDYSWRQNIEKEAGERPCVNIECCKYPSTADISFNGIINKTSMSASSVPPCEQYAVSFNHNMNKPGYE